MRSTRGKRENERKFKFRCAKIPNFLLPNLFFASSSFPPFFHLIRQIDNSNARSRSTKGAEVKGNFQVKMSILHVAFALLAGTRCCRMVLSSSSPTQSHIEMAENIIYFRPTPPFFSASTSLKTSIAISFNFIHTMS